jgi:hypothetical protein
MVRAFLAAMAIAVGVGGQTESPPPPREPHPPPASVLGVVYHEGGVAPELARLDPTTLERAGQAVRLHLGGATATAFSPSHRKLALGTADTGMEIVALRRMKRLGFVKLGAVGWVTALSWDGGTVFAVVSGERTTTAFVVDPVGRRILQRHRIDRTLIAAEPEPGGMVLLTAPPSGIGPVGLTVLGGKGLASVSVPRISGGTRTTNDSEGFRAQQVMPGLAVDPEQGRALIVAADDTVATVDLDDLAVEYHDVSRSVSLLGRLRRWLEPAADAKIVEGPQRKAVWLGGGLVAVTGSDYSGATADPIGLALLDTRDWALRNVDGDTSDVTRVGETLVATGRRSGLAGYDLEGRELYRRFEGREIDGIETSSGLAYVYLGANRRAVLDVASGRVLGRPRAGLVSVVADGL